jgi:PadR family transcriptional regulator, regulatory protein PadR
VEDRDRDRKRENYQITRATLLLLDGPANALITGSAYSSAGAKISRSLSDTETSQYLVFNIVARTDSLQGSLDLLVLKILSRRPLLHGYAIMSAIKESSGDVLRADEGSLYPALHRMEEHRWIRAEWITKDTGRRARIYELTAAGKKQLADEESRWHAVTSAVNRVLRTV